MKKIIALFVLATLFVASNAIAQTQLVATLKHGDTTRLFYGGNALQQAHDAAEDGDVITLSEGEFGDVVTLSKSITVRGAGYKLDEEKGIGATYVTWLYFAQDSKNIKVEGIALRNNCWQGGWAYVSDDHPNTKNIVFEKCYLQEFSPGTNSSFTLIDCYIKGRVWATNGSEVTLINSYCGNLHAESGLDASILVKNCVLGVTPPGYFSTGEVENSILIFTNDNEDDGGGIFPSTVSMNNTVVISPFITRDDFNPLVNITGSTNTRLRNCSEIFKTFNPSFAGGYDTPLSSSVTETFELTDEAAATYLGDDGKQVGIYGGDFPFTTTLSYPQATSVNVAKKAVDGKLAVDIKFNGAE